ncbi:MAG: DsbA family protein, partial [Chloroflexota bacterium]|nr:DsbA family protein [Chloroflexota bacterium]
DRMKERLLHAYFSEGAAVGDIDTLVRLASESGIDQAEARSVLASDAYADEVRADVRRAAQFGIRGVPFFAIDETYGVSGAQPAAALKDVLEQAWAESHPLIKMTAGSQDGGLCEGDACAV